MQLEPRTEVAARARTLKSQLCRPARPARERQALFGGRIYRAEVHDLRRTWTTHRVQMLSAPLETRGQPRRMPRRLARSRRRYGEETPPRPFHGPPNALSTMAGRERHAPLATTVLGWNPHQAERRGRRPRTLRQCDAITAAGIATTPARCRLLTRKQSCQGLEGN